jgi:hypothetical protein
MPEHIGAHAFGTSTFRSVTVRSRPYCRLVLIRLIQMADQWCAASTNPVAIWQEGSR